MILVGSEAKGYGSENYTIFALIWWSECDQFCSLSNFLFINDRS